MIVNLIASTTTQEGLEVNCELDTGHSAPGIKVSDQQMAELHLRRHDFHGDWNHMTMPRTPSD